MKDRFWHSRKHGTDFILVLVYYDGKVNPKVDYIASKIVKHWDLSSFWPIKGPN